MIASLCAILTIPPFLLLSRTRPADSGPCGKTAARKDTENIADCMIAHGMTDYKPEIPPVNDGICFLLYLIGGSITCACLRHTIASTSFFPCAKS
jgi:hypothetical protein